MGRLLSALLAETGTAKPAALAREAVGSVAESQESQPREPVSTTPESVAESQKSQTCKPARSEEQSARLLAAIRAAGFPDALLVRADCTSPELAELDDDQLRALAHMLHDDSFRFAGKPAPGDTAPAFCASCGPVLLPPLRVGVTLTPGGLPHLLACPWCAVRAKGIAIPRPKVKCGGCRERWPDSVNSRDGLSRCYRKAGEWHYPHEEHTCDLWRPR